MIDYSKVIAVTNRHLCQRPLPEQIERICQLQPRAIILREKDLPEEEYEELAARIIPICEQYHVPLTLHFYPKAAKKLGVRRIHLPLWKLEELRADPEAGRILSYFDIIGTSVHAPAEAVRAQELGASYVNAGHVFTTDCKKGLPARGLTFLQEVCQAVTIPVCAIGGINRDPEKIQAVLACGADAACIMSGMMGELE